MFFKESTSPSGGPVGALGVPLSAGPFDRGRSAQHAAGLSGVRLDAHAGPGAPMQRLTIAQDTGGAIRGAVRADYFFGNGQQAATNARRMKERGQL